jgi:hypothetical protein
MEDAAIAMISASPAAARKLLILGCGLIVVGVLLGILISFYFVSNPLAQKYNERYAQLTQNGTLKCFNVSDMREPIVLDSLEISQYCRYYCEKNPIRFNITG